MLNYVLIKGAGDVASGVALTLVKAGFRVVMTEIAQPTCVRRKVSFAEAIYEGEITVEGIRGTRAADFREALEIASEGQAAVIVDPRGETLKKYPPLIYIDAAMTKKNYGTSIDDAGIVIALGPGYEAGVDAHAVIETKRGSSIGRPLYQGTALPNTGIPGYVKGYTAERVLRSPAEGNFTGALNIGDPVNKGDIVGYVSGVPVKAAIKGTVRGLLKNGLTVSKGAKLGDIHPEVNREIVFSVTDKAWAIGKGVLEAISTLQEKSISDPKKFNQLIYEKLQDNQEHGRSGILYTLVEVPEHYAALSGAHLLVLQGGWVYGTLGSYSLDHKMIDRSKTLFSQLEPATDLTQVKLCLQDDESVAKVLEDPFLPQKKLIIFGAGHVSVSLVEMASLLGYQTVVVDDRQDLISKARFPKAHRLICAPFEEVFNDEFNLEINEMTSVVIVTRGHEYDLLCLRNSICSQACYIGMIGSRTKVNTNFSILLEEGISKKALERVAAPIGLDLGGQKPEEIALSIIAQMVALENGRTGTSLVRSIDDLLCQQAKL